MSFQFSSMVCAPTTLKAMCLAVIVLCSSNVVSADEIVFTSTGVRPVLLELYSSQGCSSCPPAQKWVNRFTESDGLWSKFIPIVFHVDYWDYIGWKDPFSSPAFSKRQRSFGLEGLVNSIYTPGFVVNGHEWKGWFRGQAIDPYKFNRSSNIGLATIAKQDKVEVSYTLSDQYQTNEGQVHIAILGFDLITQIQAGENANRTLSDNFVVLGYKQQVIEGHQQTIEYPRLSAQAEKYGLVVWTTKNNGLEPTQAVGGYLPSHWALQSLN
ncbi:MAG: DUF1223 domain-containing protein [Paraglaciecola sp.]|uniref:DUF1223 domain-containing protein n=1 Tax=Paraglaciecola sp. TaxID=1920173 RepID=UPI0032985970